MDEVKVTIETADGQKHELTGVTAICFTIKEITKDREGNMSVCGGIVSMGYRTTVRELSSALGGLVVNEAARELALLLDLGGKL